MSCVHCGRNPPANDYLLRFSPEDGNQRDVELSLCDGCLRELCLDEAVELLEPAIVSADDVALETYR